MKDRTRNIIAAVLVVFFAALCFCGAVYTDEISIVFTKASRICLECIGIG